MISEARTNGRYSRCDDQPSDVILQFCGWPQLHGIETRDVPV